LVEVMMAATILVVGFMGLIETMAVSSGMMDSARRQTLAAQILSNEIEKLRFKTWPQIQTLTPPTTIDPQFAPAIAASGATYSLSSSVSFVDPNTNTYTGTDTGLREVTLTVTWVVPTSRSDAGAPLSFTYSRTSSAYFGKYGLNLTAQRS
jgi:Tfp pilus assembly protein PilV